MELLQDSSSSLVLEQAAWTLGNLAAKAANRAEIASAGAICPLTHLRRSGTAAVQDQAARVLQRLAADAGNKVELALARVMVDAAIGTCWCNEKGEEVTEESGAEVLPPEQHVAAPATAGVSQQRQQEPSKKNRRLKEQPCWTCGATGVPLKKCSVCVVASYCGADCQKADWRGHKARCAALKAAASDATAAAKKPASPQVH